jgi:hypothetical protein
MIGKTKYYGDRPKCVYGVTPYRTPAQKRKHGTGAEKFKTISAAMKHAKFLLFREIPAEDVRVYKLCGRHRRRIVKLCFLRFDRPGVGRMYCERMSKSENPYR